MIRQRVRVGGAELELVHAGCEAGDSRQAVVFLHAGVADQRMWKAQLELLAPMHCVLAYDRRGFGRTSSPNEAFSHVSDLCAVLDALDIRQAILVGCSQGGRIAIDFALAHADRVTGLVLVSPDVSGALWPEDFEPPVDEVVAEYTRVDDLGDLEALNEFEARVWLDGPLGARGRVTGEARQQFLEMNRRALELDAAEPLSLEIEPPAALSRLAEIAAPAVVVAGGLDFPHIVSRSQQLAQRPRATFELIEDVAHLPPLEAPERFNPLLATFVATVSL